MAAQTEEILASPLHLLFWLEARTERRKNEDAR
jgi:hypothetical protein